jgi:hypothetical protein
MRKENFIPRARLQCSHGVTRGLCCSGDIRALSWPTIVCVRCRFFHLKKAIMMVNKLYILALALTGCAVAASAYVIGHYARRQDAQQH